MAAGLLFPVFSLSHLAGIHEGRAVAEPAEGAEKDAFNAAKELGTVEAWNAFLGNYASGFHADLARAYLKKLGDQPAAVAPPGDDFPAVAGSWGGIVRDGPGQNYRRVDSLDEGQRVTLMGRTDVMENGFPWFKIAYENEGSGYQWGGILCSTGAERPDIYKTCPPAPPAKSQGSTASKPAAQKGCSAGRVLIDGKCIQRGAAAGYCGPGYRPQGGKCVQGYQAPKRTTPLSTEQKKAVNKGCPKGQVWNAAEGCHYDD